MVAWDSYDRGIDLITWWLRCCWCSSKATEAKELTKCLLRGLERTLA